LFRNWLGERPVRVVEGSSRNARLMRLAVAVLEGVLVAQSARAQAPVGPQGGAQPPQPKTQQDKPKPPQEPPPSSGTAISVEVPVVTLDVVATTQHGDILTGLKRENF